MNEEPKSIWKRSIKGPAALAVWLGISTAALFTVIFSISFISAKSGSIGANALGALAMSLILVLIATLGLVVLRWLCCWKNLRRLAFAVACLVTLIALLYAEEDLRGIWAWNHFKHQWNARGEHLDLAHFYPPAVPDDQNFAFTPIMFSTYGSMIDKTGHEIDPRNTNVVNRLDLDIYRDNDWNRAPTNGNWSNGTLTDLSAWQAYYRTLPTNQETGVTTNKFPTSPQPQSPAQDLLLALSKYDSTLEELRQASRMPYSRFPLEYGKENPAMILLPHLSRLKQSAQFLQLRAIAELNAGQIEQAAADVKLMCYLVGASESEPFLISHLVRVAILNYTLQPIYEGLAGHKWTDAQLTEFNAELAKIDFLADYQRVMRSEAAAWDEIIDYTKRTRKVTPFLNMYQGQQYGFAGMDLLCYLAPSGWFHQNQIRISEFYLRKCVPVVNIDTRVVSSQAAEQAQASLDNATAHPTPYNALQYIFYLPIKQFAFDKYVSADKFAHGQATVDLARVAMALERYKLAHGEYSESLDSLTPQYLQKIPHDLMGGQPLKYRRTNGGTFLLYSIGWNEKDDGGTSSSETHGSLDYASGDWVWKYPAKMNSQ